MPSFNVVFCVFRFEYFVLENKNLIFVSFSPSIFLSLCNLSNDDDNDRRTADVRSVGYSELFSLSREDVLTAMKDYPEAQEILQTLGRKRLMEVRCVNKKHAKHAAERESIASNVHSHHTQVDNSSSDQKPSKRIVDKLRSDVKGIKNALRKSRW